MDNRQHDVFKLEQYVEQQLKQGNRHSAIKGLLALISHYARKQNFAKAETLRERIISIDPTALSEAVRAQEFIDSAKVKPASQDHLATWAELYERLTSEEAEALQTELQEISFRPGATIFAQGQKSSNLYFIDAGQAKHVFSQGNREIHIKKVIAGNVANEDSFFDAGLCTSTLVAIDRVKVHFLPAITLLTWEGHLPALEAKLRDFCAREEKIHDLLAKNYQDRRVQRRISLPGRILLKVVDAGGEVVGKTIRGDIGDVSVGGLSFFVQTPTREQALMLLGHELHLRFNMPPVMREIEQFGQVLGVRRHVAGYALKERYSVHVKFREKLPEKAIGEAERFIKMLKIAESNR
jgi:CRP-like cAMP-binding protein